MELRNSDLNGLNRLAELWKSTPDAELEALIPNLGLTGWQDIIQYLRSLGMREAPQIVKMNISVNNVRFTLEGAGVIQAYCRDNRIADKPFVAMLKESIADAEPVTLSAYSAKIKLKREVPLAPDDARITDIVANWDKLGKHFRTIQRFEFVAPGGVPVRFDISVVRENAGRPARTFQEARINSAREHYEAEVELTATRESSVSQVVQYIVRGLSWMLQGYQRSYILISNPTAEGIRSSLTGSGKNRRVPFRYPGPQPATLERKNIGEPEPGVPNLKTMPGGYNVTDKADGLRCLLHVSENGLIYLVDGGGRVYATGKKVDQSSIAGILLDGEWIRRNRKGETVSHYYAFDILASKGGDKAITSQPFLIVGAMLGSAAAKNTRQAVMAHYVGLLGNAAQTVRGVPPAENIQIGMKTFLAAEGPSIFQAGAATLDYAKSAPYNTDGLIFTPNASPLPTGRGTWAEQLKWKPPHENTIDFLVILEQDKEGDTIGTKYRDDSGQTVRHKTLRLFVGSSRDSAYADPRTTVMSGTLPQTLEAGEWREVEFRPVNPRDPMASLCYVQTDASDASDTIKTLSGDVIQSNMIVEMAYYAERAPGWRWVPTRVRHDKTERWLATRKGGMNADWVANSIWNSIHNPVTEEAICSGHITQSAAPNPIGSRRANGRDVMKVQCMKNFHDYVKRLLFRRTILAPDSTICDLATNGEDIGKWIAAPVSFALGCDVNADSINNPEDGAYRRLMDKMVELGGRDRVPPMVFVQADVTRPLRSGDAGITEEDAGLLRKVFAEHSGFDVVSLFAIHYMFRDEVTLGGFLTNLADTVKVGGYFVGCFRDGDSVAQLLTEPTVVGRDGVADVWAMTKRYGDVGSLPPTALGLGLAVDVDFVAGGQTGTEYLVSWPYLQGRLAECGLELLTGEEVTAAGLPAATQMFSETWKTAEAGGDVFSLTDAIRRLSFMNRWFVMRRRSDRRPLPVRLPDGPMLTEQIPLPLPSEMPEVPLPLPSEQIPLPEIPGPEEPEPFIVSKGTDMRLGPDLADWPFYLSLEAPAIITDLQDPTVQYPTIEAAICSAKYQMATNRPELGPTFFRVEGDIHQKAEAKRIDIQASYAAEAVQMRGMTSKHMRASHKATWNQEAWDVQKETIYKAYLNQRYKTDERFRIMINAIRAQHGTLYVAYPADPVTLGVSLNPLKGENLLGKWMLDL